MDSPHDKLDELLDLTRENNHILRKMHRKMVWGQVFTFIYWLAILGALGWSSYYFQPYIEQYVDAYQTILSAVNGIEETSKSLPADVRGFLEKM